MISAVGSPAYPLKADRFPADGLPADRVPALEGALHGFLAGITNNDAQQGFPARGPASIVQEDSQQEGQLVCQQEF